MRNLAKSILAATAFVIGLNPAFAEQDDNAAFEKTDRAKTVSAFAYALFIQYEGYFQEFLFREQQLLVCGEKELFESLNRQFPAANVFYSDPGIKNEVMKKQGAKFFDRYGEPITESEYSAAINEMNGMFMGYMWGYGQAMYLIKEQSPEAFCNEIKNKFADTFKKASNWKEALSKRGD